MRKVVLLAIVLAIGPQLASAQMTQGNGGARYAGVEGLRDASTQVMQRFVEASHATLAGSARLFNAIDQKSKAEEVAALSAQLAEDMTRQQVEDLMGAELRALSALGKAMESGAKADPAQLNEGLALLGQAVSAYDSMLGELTEQKAAIRKSLDGRKSTSALFVAKSLPGVTGDMRREIRVLAAASRKAGAIVPDVLLSN